MKVAIVADTHDNLENLRKFLGFLKKEKIKVLIHCGDVTNEETLREIEKNFEGEIFLSLGNADFKDSLLRAAKKTKIFEEKGKLEIGGLKIGFCHKLNLKEAKKEVESFDFFFFGHTHYPFIKKEKTWTLANPGNLAGLSFKATFAVLDTQERKLELKILERIE